MSAIRSHNRKYAIAGAAILAVAGGAFALANFYPALGPIAGSVAPQLYVDSISGAQIPKHGRFVLVDAASARLYMMEDGRVQVSMRVIVGKPETPTPELKSVINYETLNPYWHVTHEVAQEVIAPRVLKEGEAYLNRQGYEVVSSFRDPQPLSPDQIDWRGVVAGTATVRFASGLAPPILWATSNSIFRTATESICTILPRRSFSRRTSAPSAMAASAWKTRSGWRSGSSATRLRPRSPSSRLRFLIPCRSPSPTSIPTPRLSSPGCNNRS